MELPFVLLLPLFVTQGAMLGAGPGTDGTLPANDAGTANGATATGGAPTSGDGHEGIAPADAKPNGTTSVHSTQEERTAAELAERRYDAMVAPDPEPNDDAALGFATATGAAYATGGRAGQHYGTALGFRADLRGFSGPFSYGLDAELRAGWGSSGLFTRDRIAGYGGTRLRLPGLGALIVRAGIDGRLVHTARGEVESGGPSTFTRLLLPGGELGLHIFPADDLAPSRTHYEFMAVGGLSARTSMIGAPFRSVDFLAPAVGARVAIGSPGAFLNLQALRTLGDATTDEIEGVACIGAGYAACVEFDHLRTNNNGDVFASTRFLAALGVGLGWADAGKNHRMESRRTAPISSH